MLQQDKPDDFVIATGEQHSVRDFVAAAGAQLDMRIEWQGKGVEEAGIDAKTGRTVIKVDPRYFRPTEVETLLGDPTKARTVLGWTPELTFQDLVESMVASDLEIARRDAIIAREGFKTYRYSE
jgi:GDPmannose 4,6-dehydratase